MVRQGLSEGWHWNGDQEPPQAERRCRGGQSCRAWRARKVAGVERSGFVFVWFFFGLD